MPDEEKNALEGSGDPAGSLRPSLPGSQVGVVRPVQASDFEPASFAGIGETYAAPLLERFTASPLSTVVYADDVKLQPSLRLAVLRNRLGGDDVGMGATTEGEAAVSARVTSFDAWRDLPDVCIGSLLGRTPDGSYVVTGRIPIDRLETVARSPDVLSLEATRPVLPELDATIAALGTAPGQMPDDTSPDGGRGVVVGIVDFGGDFAHRNFRLENDGRTRLLALWDQGGTARKGSPNGYGRVHSAAEIDAALAQPDPYAALGYRPGSKSHGTHVMDIAAGNGRGTDLPGIAPNAELVFVHCSTRDVPFRGPEVVGSFLGDSVRLLEAVRFVFDTAAGKPCVCNLSLGTNGGPHDGTSLVEQGLDAIVAEGPNRAVVVAAGNSQNHGCHASGRVPGAGTCRLSWHHAPGSRGGEVEVWYSGAERLQVTLGAPDGTLYGPVAPGDTQALAHGGDVKILLASAIDDPNNHDNMIGIWVEDGMPSGEWTIVLESEGTVDFHAWIERADLPRTRFGAPDPSHNLGSISTGRDSIVVGSFNAHKPALPASSFSSSGPTRDGRCKPEVSAPGQDVLAALSGSLDGILKASGTSMAAPAVSGLIALIFAENLRTGAVDDIGSLRRRLESGAAFANGVPTTTWDPQLGHGRVHSRSLGVPPGSPKASS